MVQIIEKAGGVLVKSVNKNDKRQINIVIQGAESGENSMEAGHFQYNKKSAIISHKWVLDSISNHTILDLNGYYVL